MFPGTLTLLFFVDKVLFCLLRYGFPVQEPEQSTGYPVRVRRFAALHAEILGCAGWGEVYVAVFVVAEDPFFKSGLTLFRLPFEWFATRTVSRHQDLPQD